MSKRRGRRSLAAILAAMLMASVLAVVAGSPAQAATTAFEVKVDHDNNAKTATVREFAGTDRYDTALRLAKNFATSKGGLGAVPAAFVASGETLVDSISVAGLAGFVDAPILLTPTGSLHGGVADFIEDYDVKTVYVLGGSAAISDAAVTAIEALTAKPKVTRIAGADRYATAAAIAAMIESDANWCGSTAVSAMLINGATDMLGYGVAAQTTAYRLQMPVLMTAAGELPDATADFIRDNDVEHVQIVGGTGAVSADVASALTSLGVDTVARVDGASAAEVSVMLAKLASNGCGDDLAPVSTDRVALVRANPDGVVGAPVLASSLVAGSLVTPLIVSDTLPASVRDYLAATPKTVGGNKLNLGIVAIGGTAAVSDAVMSAALKAAASSGSLTVAIGAATDTNNDKAINASDPVRPGAGTADAPLKLRLHFSDDVAAGDTSGLLGKVQDVIEVNGVPANVTAADRPSNATTTCDNRTVEVSLVQTLRAGDVISVAGSALKFGTGSDQRTVSSASTTVQAAPADRTRPTISIVGIADASTPRQLFNVSFADAGGLATDAQLTNAEVSIVAGSGGAPVPNPTVTHTAGETAATVSIGRNLVAGDRLVIKSGAIADKAGNVSAGTSGTAIKAQASPRINTVYMSSLNHSAQNSWTVNETLVGGASGNHGITINAKATGAAAGAAGNAWTIVFDKASNHSSAKPLDIDVRVDTKGKRVTVRFNNGPATATLGDLLKAMNGHAGFAELFSAGFTTCANAATGAKTALGLTTSRNQVGTTSNVGRTKFAIEVRFNAYIDSYDGTQLMADVLARTAARVPAAADVAALIALDGFTSTAVTAANPDPPVMTVRYNFEVNNAGYLPMARDLVETQAGHDGASQIDGPPVIPAIPTVAAVATGYAADANAPGRTDNDTAHDKVDEDLNGASQRRIAVSSSVKAPS